MTKSWNKMGQLFLLIVMLPPVLVVLFMQRWFVKGLVDPEK
jgi:ABC-type glycerol-3-phosphate transport system permease component